MNWTLQIRSVITVWIATFLLFAGAAFALKVGNDFSRGSVLLFGFAGLGVLVGHHALWCRIIKSGLNRGTFRGRKAILIDIADAPHGAVPTDDLIACGFEIERRFYFDPARAPNATIEEVIAATRGSDIGEIFFAADLSRWRVIDSIAKRLSVLPIPITFIPDTSAAPLFQRPPRLFGTTFGIEFRRSPLSLAERCAKRVLDLVCAIVGIVLFMPLFVIVAIMIKMDSAGPALFIQTRQGFNSKRFGIFKFRTMTALDNGAAVKQAERDDKRVTGVGLWLRRSSIDELPQLFNVLLGTMSIVGPRPHATAHDDHYGDLIGSYAFRHHMKPGITGWAQVNGYRGETPTVKSMKKRVDLDIWYVNNWSIVLDIQIILRTALEVFRGRNAY